MSAIICTAVFLGLLWYPDLAGYTHTRLSFWLPCMGVQYEGGLFDLTGYRLITMVMAVVNGLAMLGLSIRYLSLGRANLILPFFYLFMVFSYPQARAFSASFPAALFIISGLFALFKSGEAKSPIPPLFISAFLSGCACLLYLPALAAVAGFAAIAIALHLFYGRNILVFLGGIVITLGGCMFCRYLFFDDLSDFMGIILDGFHGLHLQIVPPTPATLFMTLVFFYLLGKALMKWLRRAYGNQSYKYRVLASFMWMFIICGAPLFLYVGGVFSYLPIVAVPASVLLAYYFAEERTTKRMKVEFTVLLLAVALNQVAYFI
jgi:hypothetical protein